LILVCLQTRIRDLWWTRGAHILELLRRLQMPVHYLHTVLVNRIGSARGMEEIAVLSDRFIVMSRQSAEICRSVPRHALQESI